MSEHTTPVAPKPPSVDRLSLLWRRINDHKMVQWSVAYVALVYGVQHGVTLTSEAFEWAHAVERISMLLLALGLPVVMTLAWYHGARASRRISGPELTIISILLVIGSLLFFVFVRPSEQVAAGPAVQQAGVAAARDTSRSPAGTISIAVLVNLSSDKEQEFFSDGMTEEITAALAKIPNLQVVGRTSAFQFKGENKDLTAIGQALHATHLIEGSVRKDGNEVRITAQLIRADNGTHLWTESYNRELKGVFAVQEEIATAIANALRVPLGLKEGQSLVANRTTDTDSYQDYLRAKALVRGRGALEPGGPLTEAAKLLEQVVARDSNYAPAWGLLAQAYAYPPSMPLHSSMARPMSFAVLQRRRCKMRKPPRNRPFGSIPTTSMDILDWD
jgi:TolB-like protein